MEKFQYKKITFDVPSALCNDISVLLDIISPDTWNNVLTDENRESLMKYLPEFADNDLQEKTRTLEMFFMNEHFLFKSPLENFAYEFRMGHFNKDVDKMRQIHRRTLFRTYKYKEKNYHHNLLEEILVRRKNLLDSSNSLFLDVSQIPKPIPLIKLPNPETPFSRAKKRYFREMLAVKAEADCDSDLSEDDDFGDCLGFSLSKKRRRQLFSMESTFPAHLNLIKGTNTRGSLALDLERRIGHSYNPLDPSDEHFNTIVAAHLDRRKEKDTSLTLDTRGITLEAVLERSQMEPKRPSRPTIPKNGPEKISKSKSVPKEKVTKETSSEFVAVSSLRIQQVNKNIKNDDLLPSDDEASQNATIKNEPVCFESSVVNECVSFKTELTHETHSSFFSLLRDLICSFPQHRTTRLQLESNIWSWQQSAISPLNDWFKHCPHWSNSLPTAMNFLCGNASSSNLPSEYVPFIEHKTTLSFFQWIGAGRDSDTNLEPLCQFWLSNISIFNNVWPTASFSSTTMDDVEPTTPSKAPPVTWTSHELSQEDTTTYHGQERMRYDHPHKAYTFKNKSYETVVGPVKGMYNEPGKVANPTKVREHSLLVSSRPPFVTLLSLVRDAVSRLQNGEGAKNDICELLRESQFVVPITNVSMENTLNNVVSGALDRLQNGKDPSVKFDGASKCWIYLHRGRSENDLLRMHLLNRPQSESTFKSLQSSPSQPSRKTPKGKCKEEIPPSATPPPNVAMERCTKAIKHMDGSAVKVKEEDLLKNWVKYSGKQRKSKEKTSNAQENTIQAVNQIKDLSSNLMANGSMMRIIKASIQQGGTPQQIKVMSEFDKLAASSNLPLHVSPNVDQGTSKNPGTFTTLHTSNVDSSQVIATKKLPAGTSLVNMSKVVATPATVATLLHPPKIKTQSKPSSTSDGQVGAIKVIHYSAASGMQVPKGSLVTTGGTTGLMLDSSSGVQTLLGGQKLLLAGNRVLLQGGKVIGNMGGNLIATSKGGKQYVTAGMIPGHQLVALTTHKTAAATNAITQDGVHGRLVQIAVDGSMSAIPSGYQRVTLLPQQVSNTTQIVTQVSKASLISGSPSVRYSQDGKPIENVATFNIPSHTATVLPAGATTVLQHNLKGQFVTSTGAPVNIKQLNLASYATSPKPSGNEIKVKLSSKATNLRSGNLITLGGKQIIVATKGIQPPAHGQLAQMVTLNSTIGGIQANNTMNTMAGTQQVILPAVGGASLHAQMNHSGGSAVNLKRLQALHSFKVVGAPHHQMQTKQGPLVAHIVPSMQPTMTKSPLTANKGIKARQTLPIHQDKSTPAPPK